MTTYKPRSDKRVEAMQWGRPDETAPWNAKASAAEIVAWVNANGGEARYEQNSGDCSQCTDCGDEPRIAVRRDRVHGYEWAYAAPGHYVVMGSESFHLPSDAPRAGGNSTALRDFYPVDPNTFELRWTEVTS